MDTMNTLLNTTVGPEPLAATGSRIRRDPLVLDKGDADLEHLWETFGEKRKLQFTEKFGHIAYLASVVVDEDMIKAMIGFWNPKYRCFTFGDVDLTPTLEEYTTLIFGEAQDIALSDLVYWKDKDMPPWKIVGQMLGVEPLSLGKTYLEDAGGGNDSCLSMQTLKEAIRKPDSNISLFAMAIYGSIIFPKTRGYVTKSVIHFMEQAARKMNPVPAILAETIRTLTNCRTKGGKFIACSQLLFIWMMGHLPPLFEFGYERRFKRYAPVPGARSVNPIVQFIPDKWPEKKTTKTQWIEYFQTLQEHTIVWKAPWMRVGEVLYRCGKFPWVPLLGVWGVVSYTPMLVLRQLGYQQFTPYIEGLSEFEFSYGKPEHPEMETVRKAWKDVHREVFSTSTDTLADDYSHWRNYRDKDFTAPPIISFALEKPHTFNCPRDYEMEIRSRYQDAYDQLKEEERITILKGKDFETKLSQERAQSKEKRRGDQEKYQAKVVQVMKEGKEAAAEQKAKLEKEIARLNQNITDLQEEKRLSEQNSKKEGKNRGKRQIESKRCLDEAQREGTRLRDELAERDRRIAFLIGKNRQSQQFCSDYDEVTDRLRTELGLKTEELEKVGREKRQVARQKEMWEKEAIRQGKMVDGGRRNMMGCIWEASEMATQMGQGIEACTEESSRAEGVSILRGIKRKLRSLGSMARLKN